MYLEGCIPVPEMHQTVKGVERPKSERINCTTRDPRVLLELSTCSLKQITNTCWKKLGRASNLKIDAKTKQFRLLDEKKAEVESLISLSL
jgi:hypothetical protein